MCSFSPLLSKAIKLSRKGGMSEIGDRCSRQNYTLGAATRVGLLKAQFASDQKMSLIS
jgi:hypothetical protein